MFEKLLKKIARVLSKRKISYMVIGGHAVLVYGERRLTDDIDVTLGVGVENLTEIKKVAHQLSLKILAKDIETFVKKTMVLPTREKESGVRVDFIFSNSLYERQALKRAKKIPIKGEKVSFASLEDLVIHKVVAGRPRDIEDMKGILLKNPGYDARYVRKWLMEFDRELGQDYFASFSKIARQARG